MSRYLAYSKSGYYSAVAALPLLCVYEALLYLAGTPASGQVRNAADVWLRMVLASLGATHAQATLAMILLVALAIPVLRRRGTPLVPGYFGLMALEALGYSLLLGLAINGLLAFIFYPFSGPGGAAGLTAALPGRAIAMAMPGATGVGQGIALSLGAGLFEEFFFRVVLLSVLLGTARIFLANWLAAIAAIAGAAFIFALAHYVGSFAEPLLPHSFLYRWLAGLIFTALYFARGFAVAAYAHALYDIWVLLA